MFLAHLPEMAVVPFPRSRGMGKECYVTLFDMVINADCLEYMRTMGNESVQCVVTSPPYWGLRDYGVEGQLGLEKTPEEYVEKIVEIFREVRRVLRDDGTLWLNLGDSYAGSNGTGGRPGDKQYTQKGSRSVRSRPEVPNELKSKDLVGIPWRVALALQADGWYLRQDIIWAKPNPMPESVTDRCTKSHEYIFLLTKKAKYFYDNDAVKEDAQNWGTRDRSEGKLTSGEPPIVGGAHGGLKGKDWEENPKRNRRSVWNISTKPYKGAHFAVFPPEIPTICIKAGTNEGDTVLDPFAGSGTTLMVARQLGRKYIGIELNEEYCKIAEARLKATLL